MRPDACFALAVCFAIGLCDAFAAPSAAAAAQAEASPAAADSAWIARQGLEDAFFRARLAYFLQQERFEEAMGAFRAYLNSQPPKQANRHAMLQTLHDAAEKLESLERFTDAREIRRGASLYATAAYGQGHWQAVNARLARARVERICTFTREERAQWDAARRTLDVAYRWEPAQRGAAIQRALAIQRRLFGEASLEYLSGVSQLVEATPWPTESRRRQERERYLIDLVARVCGERSPQFAFLHYDLGEFYYSFPAERGRREAYFQRAAAALSALPSADVLTSGAESHRVLALRSSLAYLAQDARPKSRVSAADLLQSRYDMSRAVFGAQSWLARHDLFELERARRHGRVTEAERQTLTRADELNAQSAELAGKDDFAGALDRLQESVRLRAQVLGDQPDWISYQWAQTARFARKQGKPDDAAECYEQALAALRDAFGQEDAIAIDASERLRKLYNELESVYRDVLQARFAANDDEGAAEVLDRLARLLGARRGERHYETIQARERRDERLAIARLSQEQKAELQQAREAVLAVTPFFGGKPVAMEPASDSPLSLDWLEPPPQAAQHRQRVQIARAAFDTCQRLLGPGHVLTLDIGLVLVQLQWEKGDHERAAALAEDLLRRQQQADVLGASLTRTLDLLAGLCEGEDAQAQRYAIQAEAVRRATGVASRGESTFVGAGARPLRLYSLDASTELQLLRQNLHSLAEMGNYAEAMKLAEAVLEKTAKEFGARHREFAVSVSDLANLYTDLGDFAQAQRLYVQAKELWIETGGAKDAEYAALLHNLGVVYEKTGDEQRALPLIEEACSLLQDADPMRRAHAQTTLAFLYHTLGRLDESEKLYEEALAAFTASAGHETEHATCLNNFGALLITRGEYDRAQEAIEQALQLRREKLGEDHSDYADSLHDRALVADARGDFAAAERLFRQALAITRRNLEQAVLVQSERQQIAMAGAFRTRLESYLSLAQRGDLPADAVYREAFRWKGLTFARRVNLLHKAQDPQLIELAKQLHETTKEISHLYSWSILDDPAAARYELAALAERKEQVERLIARRWTELEDARPLEEDVLAALQNSLPAEAVLVDYHEFEFRIPGPGGLGRTEPRLTAFVVRGKGPVVSIGLGPMQPIQAAVERWLERRGRMSQGDSDPGIEVQRLIWAPLEERLHEAETVLVSPDGILSLFPFAALPGKTPGTYLIEERAVAVVPAPQLLPRWLVDDSSEDPSAEMAALLVGDVQFDAPAPAPFERGEPVDQPAPPSAAVAALLRGERSLTWAPLAGTRGEILAIRDSFETRFPAGEVRMLRKSAATEQALREALPSYNVIHIATHGFFPEDVVRGAGARSPLPSEAQLLKRLNLEDYYPELRAGLVLAGANQGRDRDGEDGRLTALEIANLNLSRTDLVVLSACGAGLGTVQTGEGLASLQRAFHAAGARCVVASLWEIDDRVTQAAMEKFYECLWSEEQPMGKLKALQAAQISLLREGASRGLKLIDDQPADAQRRLPPYYWAPFVLSGEWR